MILKELKVKLSEKSLKFEGPLCKEMEVTFHFKKRTPGLVLRMCFTFGKFFMFVSRICVQK